MKLAHISDLHLGYSSGNKKDPNTKINLREQDGYDIFEKIIDEIIENKVDAVLCTGDFFHTPKPSIYTIVKGQEQLNKLANANIKFYNIAGNHDATDSVLDIPANKVLDNPSKNIFSFVEPYKVIEEKDNVVLHLVSHQNYKLQKETFDNVKPIENKINILCTHGSCYDPLTQLVLHNELSPREIVIPEDILAEDWSYILMGHIHERGWVGSKDRTNDTMNLKRFYAGSILRRGFTDKECKLGRGWTLWNITDKEIAPTFFTIKQRPQYDIAINCIDKTTLEIEEEIEQTLNKLNLEETPILRITLKNIKQEIKASINWNRFTKETSQCLSFVLKFTSIEEEEKIDNSNIDFSFNLKEAYKNFMRVKEKEIDNKKYNNIIKIGNKLLDKGQEKTLSSIE